MNDERPAERGARDAGQTSSQAYTGAATSVSFERVADSRAAARRLLRNDTLSNEDRERALAGLYQRAKSEPLAEYCVRGIVAEVCWSIDRADALADRDFGEPLERRHRVLRAQGYDTCPKCLSALSREADWMRWRSLRAAAVEEIAAREGAVA
ncbi:MAG: hypothetical protein ACXWYT_00920 [Actinomycetota bacterium]